MQKETVVVDTLIHTDEVPDNVDSFSQVFYTKMH